MPGSWGYLRNEVKEFLVTNYMRESTILDVGCGQGDYINLLSDYFIHFDAVEIFEPYIEQFHLRDRYDNVYNMNIIDYEFDYYDIIIMGDILEHIEREQSIQLIKKLVQKCTELLVILPFFLPQDMVNNNIYEKHLQTDLDEESMNIFFPDLELINLNGKKLKLRIDVGDNVYYYCAYKKKKRD